jgi:TfdA family taurine catabolism dioxygenase TauD
MPTELLARTIADMPAQKASAPVTPAQGRGLLWDNRCTMHAVTPHDPRERRVMHRTTIVGDGPVLAG